MSAIIFFKTANLPLIRQFYQEKLKLSIFKDQGRCIIFRMGNMKLGFCKAKAAEIQGTITFVYPTQSQVDDAYQAQLDIALGSPETSEYFKIYHFWARDPEGRSLEFQCFLDDDELEPQASPITVPNPNAHKAKILLTRMIPENAVDKLKNHFEVHASSANRYLSKAELIAEIADKDALLCLLGDKVDSEVIDAAKKLKVISNYAVGFNNIDIDYAKEKGIAVCNTPGVLTQSTADLAWALIMATARRIPEGERLVREGRFLGWEPLMLLGQDIHDRNLGILGMGRIGQAVARRALGFGMKILYTNRSTLDLDFPAERVDLKTLLKDSDILSLHAPLTDETHHILGEDELKLMKKTAILINTARGALVDEMALIKALKAKQIFAAGFDVYEHEPEIPQELLDLENVVLLPHIGSASLATRAAMGDLAAENAIAVVRGREAPARVN